MTSSFHLPKGDNFPNINIQLVTGLTVKYMGEPGKNFVLFHCNL
jgi:hypothetical protein